MARGSVNVGVPKKQASVESVIEQNKKVLLKFWKGTQEEFDALAVKDFATTKYIITDAEGNIIAENGNAGDPVTMAGGAEIQLSEGLAEEVQPNEDGGYVIEMTPDEDDWAASTMPFDHSTNGMTADNVQAAIEEVNTKAQNAADAVGNVDVAGPIKTHNESTAAHADIRQLITNLSNALSGKAATDLSNVEASALLAAIESAGGGGAKIATGSYTGTGTYGSANPCSLTFDFEPRFFCIYYEEIAYYTSSSMTTILKYVGGSLCAVFPNALKTNEWCGLFPTTESYPNSTTFYMNFSGKTASWYNTSGSTTKGETGTTQYNRKDAIYHWFAVA